MVSINGFNFDPTILFFNIKFLPFDLSENQIGTKKVNEKEIKK